ncbi:MAG: polysaccharide ABC transporter ATP-binding protein [Paracoccaceae bacterium]
MTDLQVEIKNLSKKYQLGVDDGWKDYGYHVFGFNLPFQKLLHLIDSKSKSEFQDANTFWALKDINLNVMPGEVLGIVGKNGSGKSTLLKILAKVTPPSSGYARVRGQVGSLLEVGTGFHHELTGRQNIYLNASIMGMTKDQTDQKLEEIIDFAEVDNFIDTPVKFYSSGMYMRLAFSVAANMDTDVLLVDEVLAVGDIHFQRKCLSRVDDDVSKGKTVFFVSHNTSMVLQTCSRAILLDAGQIVKVDSPQKVVNQYTSADMKMANLRQFNERDAPYSPDREFRLWSVRLMNGAGEDTSTFNVTEDIYVELKWDVLVKKRPLNVHIYLWHESGVCAFVSMDNLVSPYQDTPPDPGRYTAVCVIHKELLNEGNYNLEFTVCTRPTTTEYADFKDAVTIIVTDDMTNDGVRHNWFREWFPSIFRPRLNWLHYGSERLDKGN